MLDCCHRSAAVCVTLRRSLLTAVQANTQSRVALLTVLETLVLGMVTVLQVWYIKNLVNKSPSRLPGSHSSRR